MIWIAIGSVIALLLAIFAALYEYIWAKGYMQALMDRRPRDGWNN